MTNFTYYTTFMKPNEHAILLWYTLCLSFFSIPLTVSLNVRHFENMQICTGTICDWVSYNPHKIKLAFARNGLLANTLSYSTGHGFVETWNVVCSELVLHRQLTNSVPRVI